ncbi:MAG TPA: hypothetical protein VK191_16550 [Symbiobacteriaceae bacterium]|nr:hypothetical protein [Symbiobacteriaceae bacterium]
MLLHIADETGEVLYCPKCDRELWPAYWTGEGLKVGFESDFEPEDGQAGLLVCGDLNCTHEEPITFVQGQDDAVIWNYEDTYMQFDDNDVLHCPQTWIQEVIDQVERVFARTGRAKLRSALALYREQLAERQQKIERWLARAANGYPVRFQAEEEELCGQILGSHAEVVVLQMPDGQVRMVPKNLIWREMIDYPCKERRSRKGRFEDELIGFSCGDRRHFVVGGHHLRYGGRTEFGGFYKGRCWDPVLAAELQLREVEPGYWEGAFQAEEIERFYHRRDYVKIRGYWLEEVSREEEHRVVWARTKDLAVATELDMEPLYARNGDEFGSWDGDILCYDEYFSIDEIEESRWEEELQPLPTDEW